MSVIDSDRPAAQASRDRKPPRSARSRGGASGSHIPYILIIPAAVVMIGILGYPLFKLFQMSFQNVNSYMVLFAPAFVRYIGFENFSAVLSDPTLWQSVERTVYLTVEVVALSLLIGMGMALLLNRVSPWVKVIVVTVMMFVWSVPAIVTGTLYRWLFAGQGGIIDYICYLLGGKGMLNHDWFANPTQGLYVVVAACMVWGALPFLVIGLNAAMTQVPKELVEASKIDGASPWQSFRHVVIPVIRPFLILVSALSFIWDFQVFGQIWALRENSPEPGYQTIGIYLYVKGFSSSHYSNSAVISLVMILLMLAVLIFYIRQVIKIGAQD